MRSVWPARHLPQDPALAKAVSGPAVFPGGLCRAMLTRECWLNPEALSSLFSLGWTRQRGALLFTSSSVGFFFSSFLIIRNCQMQSTPSPLSLFSTLGWRKSNLETDHCAGCQLVRGCPQPLLPFPQHKPSPASSSSSRPPTHPTHPLPVPVSQPELRPSPCLGYPSHFFIPTGVSPILRG